MAESAPPVDVTASEPVPDDPTRPRSDASVATNVIVNSPIEILPESKEIYVHVEICASNENPKGNVPVMKHLKGFLWTLWNCYTPGIIMYDKENKHISKSVIEHLKTLPQFTKLFTTIYRKANDSRPGRHILVFKIKTPHTLHDIKNHEDVDLYLRDFNIYIREHHFPDYTLDSVSLGWIFGRHPTNHDRDNIKQEMSAAFKAACPTLSIPYFHVSPCTPSRIEDSGRKFFSQALAIHVAGNKSRQLMTLLKTTYNNHVNSIGFIPWDWKKGKKEAKDAYRDAMVAQSNYVANCYVVPIHGITEDQMKILRPRLLAAPGIESVEHTKKTVVHGRWDVICKKLYFAKRPSEMFWKI
jgi:hypothetical protein